MKRVHSKRNKEATKKIRIEKVVEIFEKKRIKEAAVQIVELL